MIRFAAIALFASCASAVFSAEPAAFDIRDEGEFARIVPAGAKLEKLGSGMKFIEGPCWFPQRGCLIFSDIPASKLMKWGKEGLSIFREESNQANGNGRDAEGRLVSCEHKSRRVTRTEKDGRITVLAEKFEGKRLNSPNDLAIRSDGAIYFTDPPYGLPGRKEGKELEKNFVFRLDPKTGELKALVGDFDMPNGIAFSPDEKRLYIADSGRPHHIRVFNVGADGGLSGGEVFCTIEKGLPDGIRVDAAGRLFSSAGDGVQIFAPDGRLIGRILVPESPANLAFGGEKGSELFITARTSLYRIALTTTAARK